MSQRPRARFRLPAAIAATAVAGGLLFAAAPARAAGDDVLGPSIYSSYTPSDSNGDGVVGDIGDTLKVTYQLSNDLDTSAYSACSLYATLVGAVGVDVPFSGSTLPKGSSAYKSWNSWPITGGFTDTFYGSCKDSAGWHAWRATTTSWSPAAAPVRSLGISGSAATSDSNRDGVPGDTGDALVVTYVVTNTGQQTMTLPTVITPIGPFGTNSAIPPGGQSQVSVPFTVHAGVNDLGAYAVSTTTTPDNVTITSGVWGGSIAANAAPERSLAVSSSITSTDDNGDGVDGDLGDTATAHYIVTNTGNQGLGVPTVDGGSAILGTAVGSGSITAGSQQGITKAFAITPTTSAISSSVTASALTITGDNVTVTSAPSALKWAAAAAPLRSLSVALAGDWSISDTNTDGVAGDVGDVINYPIEVSNTGDQALGQVMVHGIGTDAGAGTPAGIAAGGTELLVLRHSVTAAEVAAGTATATATVSARTTTPDNLVITSPTLALPNAPTVPAPHGGDTGKTPPPTGSSDATPSTGSSSSRDGAGSGSGSTAPTPTDDKRIASSFGFGFGPGAADGLPSQWPTSWKTKIQKVKTTTPIITSSVKIGSELAIANPVKAQQGLKMVATKINGRSIISWKKVTITPKYQWYAGGKRIKGATHSALRLTLATAGKAIVLKVDGHKVATKVALVASRVGATLTAHATNIPQGAEVGYQWYANGKVLKTGTKAKFTVPPSLKGKRLTVKFAVAKHGYAITTSKASTKTNVTAAAPKKPNTHKVTVTISTSSKAKVTVNK